jgi:hypothetical protein
MKLHQVCLEINEFAQKIIQYFIHISFNQQKKYFLLKLFFLGAGIPQSVKRWATGWTAEESEFESP